MANKAYKFRIYPTDEQKNYFARTFGCVRFVYNACLNLKKDLYELDKTRLSYTDCADFIAMLKHSPGYEWLNEADSTALQQSLKHLDQAYKNFFKDPKRCGYPRYKSRKNPVQSYTAVNNNNAIRVEYSFDRLKDGSSKKTKYGFVRLPKVGFVKAKIHRTIPAEYTIKSATVSVTASGEYYVSILCEYDNQVQKVKPQRFLGMDYSMTKLYVDSDGNIPEYPKFYRKAETKLAREQRKLSLMQKGSKNWEKQRIRVARLHRKVANQRQDFLHKLSRKLADSYDIICIEDLNMSALSKSLHFGKSVHDNSWGIFTGFLAYKMEDRGGELKKADKWFPSSQLCSVCGHKNKKVKDLSVREWTCPVCGTTHDRDKNAAINLREEGKRLAAASWQP